MEIHPPRSPASTHQSFVLCSLRKSRCLSSKKYITKLTSQSTKGCRTVTGFARDAQFRHARIEGNGTGLFARLARRGMTGDWNRSCFLFPSTRDRRAARKICLPEFPWRGSLTAVGEVAEWPKAAVC